MTACSPVSASSRPIQANRMWKLAGISLTTVVSENAKVTHNVISDGQNLSAISSVQEESVGINPSFVPTTATELAACLADPVWRTGHQGASQHGRHTHRSQQWRQSRKWTKRTPRGTR